MSKNLKKPSFPLYARVLLGVGLGLGTLLGVGWYFADGLVHVYPVRRRVYRTRVLGLEEGHGHTHVTLTRTPTTERPGVVLLEWSSPGGVQYAQLGPLLKKSGLETVREVQEQDSPLRLGQLVRASTVGLGTPAQRGLRYLDVTVPGQHGPAPAWLVAAQDREVGLDAAGGSDWVIVTHGYRGLRQDTLRILPTLSGLGLTSLVITYRNAEGAPSTPQGVYRLSAEEWQDLEAAVRYAEAHGAKRILLYGFSMGGSISLAFLRYSGLAGRISGVLLDSPALEWRALITHHARRYRLPIPLLLSRAVAWLTVFKARQDFDAVDHLSVKDTFNVPMLIFHGSADKTVPIGQVESFVHARPDIVEYHRYEGAGHEQAWNKNPQLYEQTVRDFVRRILNPPAAAPQPASQATSPGREKHV
jgi:alpha-beta hydrolase superfamily lysophospholipase